MKIKYTVLKTKAGKQSQFTPASSFDSFTCMADIVRPSFDMLCKRLKDYLTVKLAIFPVINEKNDKQMIITESANEKKICMFPDLRDNSNDLSVVNHSQ